MNKLSRLSVALGSGLVLSLGALAPVATATAAPAASSHLELVENPVKAAVEAAVPPSPCGPTLIDDFIDAAFAEISDPEFNFLLQHVDTFFDVPTYAPLLLGTSSDPDYALREHAQQLKQSFRDAKTFWSDVQSDDIQLMAMHSDVLLDEARLVEAMTAMVEFGVWAPMTPEQIAAEADTVATFMQGAGDFYTNPLWTLNAYAFSGEGDPDPAVAALPDKLVFGDGVLEFLDWAGIGDVGPRAVMGHEFGHHIQYEIGTFDSGPADPAEATRRTELMADAMASYFATHKNGEAMNKKRVVDALLTSYSVGDCEFASPGHHGTPLQRERAAAWGADLAAAAKPKSLVLPATDVEERFDAALAGIVSG